jgi:hypothetical protein
MRRAVDGHARAAAPSIDDVVREIGPLTNSAPSVSAPRPASEGARRGRAGRRGDR